MGLEVFILGFTLGIFSSFHCVGMCGAIAFSLPVNSLAPQKRYTGIMLYNAGRVITYSLFGLLFGVVGRQLFVAGIQQWFTILAGLLLLAGVVYSMISHSEVKLTFFKRSNALIFRGVSRYIKSGTLWSTFMIGIVNGFLPCGMVYLAITGAVATGSVSGSMAFMAAFGVGTVPAMFAFTLFSVLAHVSVRNFMRKTTPYVMSLMAVLLILRGLNLGIPYLSPNFDNKMTEMIECH